MSTKLSNLRVQPRLRKQGCDLSSQSAARGILLFGCATHNISHLFLHASAMPAGTALQPCFDLRLDIANNCNQ